LDKNTEEVLSDLKKDFQKYGLKNGSLLILREPGKMQREANRQEQQNLMMQRVESEHKNEMFMEEKIEKGEKKEIAKVTTIELLKEEDELNAKKMKE